jgi:hypothetical protein
MKAGNRRSLVSRRGRGAAPLKNRGCARLAPWSGVINDKIVHASVRLARGAGLEIVPLSGNADRIQTKS